MKHSYLKVFPVAFTLCILILLNCFRSYGQAAAENIELFGTSSNRFLFCTSPTVTVCLTDQTGKIQKRAYEPLENAIYQNVQIGTDGFYIFCSNDMEYNGHKEYAAVMMLCNTNGDEVETVFFDAISLKTGCAAYDTNKIYLVDRRSSDIIQIYNKDGGSPQTSVSVGSTVEKLFVYNNSNVYALAADGVYSVTSSGAAKIGSLKPQTDFYFYGNLCCTSNGKIYTFDTQKGFSFYFSSDNQHIAVMNNRIYASNRNMIYCLDLDGKIRTKYTANDTITDLCAANNCLAFVTNGNIHIINADDFSMVQSEVSKESSENSRASKTENSQSSSFVSGGSEMTFPKQVQSSVYNLNQSLIEIPCGKTIAQLKKEITYTGYTACFFDYNHKIKTSGILGTGAELTLTDNTKSYTYTFWVCGDISGEGNLNTRDITALSDYLIGKSDLTDLQLQAANLNKDNTVDTADLLSLYKQTALL